jgi:polar amino acid transport system permease protein
MDILAFAVEIFPTLLRGAYVTLQIVALSIVLGLALGVLLALARVYGGAWIYRFSTAYVEVFRGTPLLVQLFVLYYGLPNIGIYMTPFLAAVIGMGMNSAAYQSEYFRGAIQSIRGGQMLAARAIGMTHREGILNIILPQMVRRALPSWSNELMYMIKYSSVAYMIQTPELMAAGKEVASETFRTFEAYVVVGFIYLVIVLIVSKLLKQLEARIQIPGL